MKRSFSCLTAAIVLVAAGCGGDSFQSAPSGSDSGVTDAGTDALPESGAEAGSDAAEDVASTGLSLSPDTYEFPPSPIGVVAEPALFTVQNTGDASTGVLMASVTGQGMAVANNSCTELEPNGTCSIVVTFLPQSNDDVEGELTVTSPQGGSATASLIGHAEAVVSNGLSIDPPHVLFDPVAGGDSTVRTIAIQNTGASVLSNLVVTASTQGVAPVFSVASNGCEGISLAPNSECPVTLSFSPLASEPGVKTGEVVVVSGASTGTASLRGHTTDLWVSPTGNDSNDGLSPSTPVRTISHGLELAGSWWSVHLMPGTYGSGETFPLEIQNERVLGMNTVRIDASLEADLGSVFVLAGDHPELRAVEIILPTSSSAGDRAAIVTRPSGSALVENVTVNMQTGWTGLGTDLVGQASVDTNGLLILCSGSSGNTRGIAVYGAAQFMLDSGVIDGCDVGMTIDGNAVARVRNTDFANISHEAVDVQSPNVTVDFGISDPIQGIEEPGYNAFFGSAQTFVGLRVGAAVTVDASGNSWMPNIQGADSEGEFAAGTIIDQSVQSPPGAKNFVIVPGASARL